MQLIQGKIDVKGGIVKNHIVYRKKPPIVPHSHVVFTSHQLSLNWLSLCEITEWLIAAAC